MLSPTAREVSRAKAANFNQSNQSVFPHPLCCTLDAGLSKVPIGIASSVSYSKANERPGREHKAVVVGVSGEGKTVRLELMLSGGSRKDQMREVDDSIAFVTATLRQQSPPPLPLSPPPSVEVQDDGAAEISYYQVLKKSAPASLLYPHFVPLRSGCLPKEITVIPGSFNPLHAGHLAMCKAAAPSGEVYYELSLNNVDKPSVKLDDLQRRIEAFRDTLSTEWHDPDSAGGRVGAAATDIVRCVRM